MSAHTAPRLKQQPWWLEMARADFRHALWPWLVYAAAIISLAVIPAAKDVGESGPEIVDIWAIIGVFFGGSSFIAAAFTADFDARTAATLLTFPRDRNRLWWARAGFIFTLMILPFVAFWILYPLTSMAYRHSSEARQLAMMLLLFGYCFFGIGACLSVVLRKSLVVMSAAIISPLILLLLFMGLDSIVHFEHGIYSTPGRFPYMPMAFPIFAAIIVTALFLLARQLWLRLEVRQ